MGGRAGAGAVGLAARAGVAGGGVRTLRRELRVLERAPAGIGARLARTPCRAILGRAAMGTKPRYWEINSWTFWPGFCRTNLAGTRGN